MSETKPCIGLLEFNSIGRGIFATDQVLKKSQVTVLFSKPVCPGKYTVLFSGEVEEVSSSLRIGAQTARASLVDELFIPNVEPGLFAALNCTAGVETLEALGVIETYSVASTLIAADVASKTARIILIEIRLAMGIGGKAYFTFTGEVSDVKAAAVAASRVPAERGLLASQVVIPSPHPGMRSVLL